MTVVYSEDVLSCASGTHWAAEFRQGRSLQDEPQSGCQSEAVCENCRAMENIVLQNRRVIVQLMADSVGISTGSVKTILCVMTKVCAR